MAGEDFPHVEQNEDVDRQSDDTKETEASEQSIGGIEGNAAQERHQPAA